MRRSPIAIATFLAVSLVLAAPAADARDGVELGFDGALGVQIIDDEGPFEIDDAFSIDIPVSTVRAAFPVGRSSQLEPRVSVSYVTQGDFDLTQIDLQLHYVHNFDDEDEEENGGAWPYVGIGGVFSFFDASGADGSQFGVAAGAGVKIPATEHLAWRLGGEVTRRFESDDFFGSWEIRGLFGFSFFTR